jgi:hypothetical protein
VNYERRKVSRKKETASALLRLRHQLQDRIFVVAGGIRLEQLLPSGDGSESVFLTLPLYDAEIEKGIRLLGKVTAGAQQCPRLSSQWFVMFVTPD